MLMFMLKFKVKVKVKDKPFIQRPHTPPTLCKHEEEDAYEEK